MRERDGRLRLGTRRWEGIIFDCDGVLLDTEACWTRAEEALFASYGKDFTPENKRSLLGTGGPAAGELLERMLELPGGANALLTELHELARREFTATASATEGAVELLRELAGKFRIGLASNTPRALVEVALSQAAVDIGNFGAIVCADEVPLPKPAPDVYEAVCSQLGVVTSSVARSRGFAYGGCGRRGCRSGRNRRTVDTGRPTRCGLGLSNAGRSGVVRRAGLGLCPA